MLVALFNHILVFFLCLFLSLIFSLCPVSVSFCLSFSSYYPLFTSFFLPFFHSLFLPHFFISVLPRYLFSVYVFILIVIFLFIYFLVNFFVSLASFDHVALLLATLVFTQLYNLLTLRYHVWFPFGDNLFKFRAKGRMSWFLLCRWVYLNSV